MHNCISKSTHSFKLEYDATTRKQEYEKIKAKYPDKIPIIIEETSQNPSKLVGKCNKVIISADATLAHVVHFIKKRRKTSHKNAIILYVNGNLYTLGQVLKDIYEKDADKDGFLYATYMEEITFG